MPCEQKKKYAEIPGLPFRVLVQHTQYLQRQERESTRTQYSERKERESTRTRTHTMYFTERAHAHTHTIYFTERERTHAHTMYLTERGDNAQNIPMRTYTPQSLIANTACKLRALTSAKPCFNHCCISSAAAQKQSICKCQCMDFRVAQRSMIRTSQYLNVPSPLFVF